MPGKDPGRGEEHRSGRVGPDDELIGGNGVTAAAEFELHTGTYPEDREPGKKLGGRMGGGVGGVGGVGGRGGRGGRGVKVWIDLGPMAPGPISPSAHPPISPSAHPPIRPSAHPLLRPSYTSCATDLRPLRTQTQKTSEPKMMVNQLITSLHNRV
jgi:hypothetical protein